MKYVVKPSNRFKRDVKRAEKRGYNINLLTDVIKKISSGEQLSRKYMDHPLKGEYINCRECHIAPNWLLIYELLEDDLILYLTRTGTHEDLFKM